MSVNRRFVLKSMAVSSFAGWAMGSSKRTLAGPSAAPFPGPTDRPLLALVGRGTAAASAFVCGAAAAGGPVLQVETVGRDLGFMLDLERRMRGGGPIQVIGLLDDASATLVVDLARGAGARMQWLGQHSVAAAYARHEVLDTEATADCWPRLGRGRNDRSSLDLVGSEGGAAATQRRGRAQTRQSRITSRNRARSIEWASDIGYALASLGRRPATSPPAASGNVAPYGSFVSFSIEA